MIPRYILVMGQPLVWEESGAAILICRKDRVGRGFLLLAEKFVIIISILLGIEEVATCHHRIHWMI